MQLRPVFPGCEIRINLMFPFLLMALLVSSCIKPFNPDVNPRDVQKYVITGQLTDDGSLQILNISKTSLIGDPKYLPVTGCSVKILDNKGNEFPMQDMGLGDYTTMINPGLILPGISYKVKLTTPTGDVIESDFDQLTDCPKVDSIYFLRKDLPGNNPAQLTRGIQFYVDLNAAGSESHYYRWEAVETWEYHAEYPLEWYYDGTVHKVSPPDYSRQICWSTLKVADIYTLSTNNLVINKYAMLPLHFVSNRTSRLAYGYSLLIKQYAMSEAAYIYWDQLRINSSQEGGLYTKQPLKLKGNLHNLTHPEVDVLGFFGATSMKSKRIFIRNVPGLLLDFNTFCSPVFLVRGFQAFGPDDYPVYLMTDRLTKSYTLTELGEDCVNCLSLGGKNVKPDFWPN